jgi:hypothetical protein
VEFRVEQHLEALNDRLGVLGFGTTNDTTEQAEAKTEIPTAPKSDRDKDFRSGPGAGCPFTGA